MFSHQPRAYIRFPANQTPLLMVIVDTEAEFDWSEPKRRHHDAVASVREQIGLHDLFSYYRIKPVYVIDYSVASNPNGYLPLRERYRAGDCVIGAHLQPWCNPPFTEDISLARNSYAGNLAPELERAKLQILTDTIEENVGARPRIYRAGRFGIGPDTFRTLSDLGYEIDSSVVPDTSFTDDGGPDFTGTQAHPWWCDPEHRLLEIPLSTGYTGMFRDAGSRLYGRISGPLQRRLHLPGVLAHLGLIDRVRLSPEGIPLVEQRRLTRALYEDGCRVFSLTYHSSSLVPGSTPYVRSSEELRVFRFNIEQYLDYFFGEFGGAATTPNEVKAMIGGLEEGSSEAGPAPYVRLEGVQ